MRKALRSIASAVVFAIVATAVPASAVGAAATDSVSTDPVSSRSDHEVRQIAPGVLPQETYEATLDVLSVVYGIPEHFITFGDEAGAAQWVTDEFHRRGWLGCPECVLLDPGPDPGVHYDKGKCLAGWALALASAALWIGKALKLWYLVHEAGGFKKVIDLIMQAFKRSSEQRRDALNTLQEVFNEVAAGMGAVAAEVLAIDGIIDNCF
ncbi:hypothetical protein [Saccharothrix stipae]